MGCPLCPHPLLVEVGFLWCHGNMNFLRPPRGMRHCGKLYCWGNIKGVPCQGPISLCPPWKSPILSSAGLSSKPLPRVFAPYYSPVHSSIWLVYGIHTFSTSSLFHCAWTQLPFVGALPPEMCREWTGGPLRSSKFQLPGGHAYHFLPPFFSFPVISWLGESQVACFLCTTDEGCVPLSPCLAYLSL